MTPEILYAAAGVALFCLAAYTLVIATHLLRKLLAVAVMSTGVFLVLVGPAARTAGERPDPVPHVLVLTGIVVAVSGLALALSLIRRIWAETGRADLSEDP